MGMEGSAVFFKSAWRLEKMGGEHSNKRRK